MMSYLPTLGPNAKVQDFPNSVQIRPLSRNDDLSMPSPKGFLSADLHLAYVFQGCQLEVLRAKTNERVAAWEFANFEPSDAKALGSLNSYANEITCVTELITPGSPAVEEFSNVQTGSRSALVGLANGCLCVIDLKRSKVIRCIKIGYCITSVEVISAAGGPSANHRAFSEELMFFHGIAVVGTTEGHIYLVDLALDNERISSTETNPASLIKWKESSDDQIADTRQKLLRRGQHLAIALNDSFYKERTLQHTSSVTGNSTYFPDEQCVVCSVKYIPHLASVAVGFNYGAWQLWNLSRLWLDYSSPYTTTHSNVLSVVDFTFQEPENDPKNFCYIWVVHSNDKFQSKAEKFDVDSFATLKLYALSYNHRDNGEQYGVLYSGLTSCMLRFEHTLNGLQKLHGTAIQGTLALSSSTLGFNPMTSLVSNRCLASADLGVGNTSDLDEAFSTLGLSVFTWEVVSCSRDDISVQSQYYFGLFDLNAWYQEVIPRRNDDTNFSSVELLCLGVDVDSLSRYQSNFSGEQDYYPSSLAFEMICLLDSGFVYAFNMGLQRKILSEFQLQGGIALVEPEILYRHCVLAGMIELTDNTMPLSEQEQRKKLLTVTLENHLLNFLVNCIESWSDGRYFTAGCNLKLILEWAWEKVTVIKQNIDQAIKPLFDHSFRELNHETRKSLMQKSRQLHHLCTVFKELLKYSGIVTEDGIDELGTKQSVCTLIHQYLQVVLWFFNAGLLPETAEEANEENSQLSNNPYPVNLLVSMYETKRKRMTSYMLTFSTHLQLPALIIDGVCQELGERLHVNFKRDGGRGNYPPPSLFSLLSTYLIPDSETDLNGQIAEHCKHRLIQYIFLDIASYLNGEKWSSLVDNLIKFPSAFGLPPSMIKLTQAFWLLDHEDFEEALNMLLDPIIANTDITLWQHRTILLAFLIQDHPKLALKYARMRRPPQNELIDLQLHIAILLANGMVHEAFQFQRQKCKVQNVSNMLQYFFERAEELKKLDTILQLSLTLLEEKELNAFLKKSTRPKSQEILLMYYLQRNRYAEAMALNEHLDSRPGGKEKNSTRHAIMKRFSNTNLISSSLLSQYNNPTSLVERMGLKKHGILKPVPLSVEIRSKDFNPMFHSSTIQEEMERQAKEFSIDRQQNFYTPFRPRHKRFGWSRANNVEEGEKQLQSLSITFPKDTSMMSESFICDEQPNVSSTASFAFKSPTSQVSLSQHNQTKNMILAFLETPKIKKASKGSRLSSGAVDAERSIATPQSILKIKKLMSKQTPSESRDNTFVQLLHDMENDNWLMSTKPKSKALETVTREQSRSRESTPGKSLRFHVPKTYPSKEIEEDKSVNSSKIDSADGNNFDESQEVVLPEPNTEHAHSAEKNLASQLESESEERSSFCGDMNLTSQLKPESDMVSSFSGDQEMNLASPLKPESDLKSSFSGDQEMNPKNSLTAIDSKEGNIEHIQEDQKETETIPLSLSPVNSKDETNISEVEQPAPDQKRRRVSVSISPKGLSTLVGTESQATPGAQSARKQLKRLKSYSESSKLTSVRSSVRILKRKQMFDSKEQEHIQDMKKNLVSQFESESDPRSSSFGDQKELSPKNSLPIIDSKERKIEHLQEKQKEAETTPLSLSPVKSKDENKISEVEQPAPDQKKRMLSVSVSSKELSTLVTPEAQSARKEIRKPKSLSESSTSVPVRSSVRILKRKQMLGGLKEEENIQDTKKNLTYQFESVSESEPIPSSSFGPQSSSGKNKSVSKSNMKYPEEVYDGNRSRSQDSDLPESVLSIIDKEIDEDGSLNSSKINSADRKSFVDESKEAVLPEPSTEHIHSAEKNLTNQLKSEYDRRSSSSGDKKKMSPIKSSLVRIDSKDLECLQEEQKESGKKSTSPLKGRNESKISGLELPASNQRKKMSVSESSRELSTSVSKISRTTTTPAESGIKQPRKPKSLSESSKPLSVRSSARIQKRMQILEELKEEKQIQNTKKNLASHFESVSGSESNKCSSSGAQSSPGKSENVRTPKRTSRKSSMKDLEIVDKAERDRTLGEDYLDLPKSKASAKNIESVEDPDESRNAISTEQSVLLRKRKRGSVSETSKKLSTPTSKLSKTTSPGEKSAKEQFRKPKSLSESSKHMSAVRSSLRIQKRKQMLESVKEEENVQQDLASQFESVSESSPRPSFSGAQSPPGKSRSVRTSKRISRKSNVMYLEELDEAERAKIQDPFSPDVDLPKSKASAKPKTKPKYTVAKKVRKEFRIN